MNLYLFGVQTACIRMGCVSSGLQRVSYLSNFSLLEVGPLHLFFRDQGAIQDRDQGCPSQEHPNLLVSFLFCWFIFSG